MRYLFLALLFMVLLLLYLQPWVADDKGELPIFLRTDAIAANHQVPMQVTVRAPYPPQPFELVALQQDYAAIWAHLNHLFATGEVTAGKEYYTEGWFRHLCNTGVQRVAPAGLQRTDLDHRLLIRHWSTDALVCMATDTVQLQYKLNNEVVATTKAALAVSLLRQGDHWRIDAIRFINTKQNTL